MIYLHVVTCIAQTCQRVTHSSIWRLEDFSRAVDRLIIPSSPNLFPIRLCMYMYILCNNTLQQ